MHTEVWLPQLGKISLDCVSQCERAINEFSQITGIPRTIKKKGWGGYLGLVRKGVYFVATYTRTKPPMEKVVAWPQDPSIIWLPTERLGDLDALCKYIGEVSLGDFVVWNDFVNMDYGLIEQKSPPRVVDFDVCREFEIDVTPYEGEVRTEEGTLWWQEWGGALFAARLIESDGGFKFDYRLLARHVGRFKRIPIHRRR
jgi:hypothetical protein